MDILEKTKKFYLGYKGEKFVIGKSEFNKPIYCFAVKKTERPKVIIQYCIHAREYVTAYLALKHIDRFNEYAKFGTVYFIPIMNPDGVKICLDFNPLYKANGRGVDLNVNFDARWGTGEFNKTSAGDKDFIGEKPFSERETKALRDFTIDIKPDLTISYHAKGEEIYWQFFQDKATCVRDLALAKAVARLTGYKIKATPNSAGGYKDWCVQELKIPALTIEVGPDELTHPITEESIDDIYIKNERVPEMVTEYLWERICR